MLKTAFAESGVDFDDCEFEDRGDGALILLPHGTAKAVVADRLPDRFAAVLRRYNHTRTPQAQLRLRVSLNAGAVHNDGFSWGGDPIDTAFRILDAHEAKNRFAESGRTIALISSQQFFDDVISRDPALLPESYSPIPVSVKAFTGTAYLRLLGEPPSSAALTQQPVLAEQSAAARTDDEQADPAMHGTALDMIPRTDLVTLRHRLTRMDVPHLAVMMSRALGPAVPLPRLENVTDAWSALLVLSDYNAGPDGIPPAITFLRLLAAQLDGEAGASITAWINDQARALRLGPMLARQAETRHAPLFHLECHYTELDDLLVSDGPDLAGLFEPPLPDAQQADSRGFPISIYLSTAAGHELVQAAVEDLVRTAGAEIIELGDPEIGSWMRRLVGRLKDAANTPAGRDAAVTAAHAVEARLVQAQDATNTATLMQNLAPTLTALQHTPSAVVRVGALLIVKNGDALAVHQLTAAQQFQLNHKPALLTSPHDILRALGLHATESPALTTTAPVTPPAPPHLSPVPPGGEPADHVGPAWQRITTWLHTHTPATAATLRPPAPAAEIHAVQHALGHVLPGDLLEWWSLMDGVNGERDHHTAFTLPGTYFPLPVRQVRQTWASLTEHPAEHCCRRGAHQHAAGTTTAGFCTALLPICQAHGGAVLAIDLRPGTEHGRVMEWVPRTGARRSIWANIEALLTDTAQRLDQRDSRCGTPPRPGDPVIRDGALTWT
ncbi:hypothetical protein C791_4290 [Amycolatopsis azurea DSM 43854]|uniref:Knr4/Smi1-like domain-containing protein n=1 Tax=Amycolatopsis azurea DSM 43854 TaxID=1238180 RepID=M2QSE3_9PSEU|nr:hypothetical protein C791_4290 [Amycolatopsis azurea DSM 43854]